MHIVLVACCATLLLAVPAPATDSGRRPKLSVDDLRALLLNSAQTDRARIRAAGLLGELADPRAEAALLEALSDPKETIRFGAAGALGQPGRSAPVERLVKLLTSPEEGVLVRGAAARTLGTIGDPRAVPALLATRQDGSAELRVAGRQALLMLPPASSPLARGEVLGEILTDGGAPEWARANAARMLGEHGDARSVPLLVAALAEPGVPSRPIKSLGDFLLAREVAKNSLPAAAARALGALGAKDTVPALIEAVRSSQGEGKIAALEVLAKFQAREAIAVSIGALGDREPRARRWAALLLAELGAPDALPHLRAALADADGGVRLQATRAVVRMGDVAAVDQLMEAFAKESIPEVRSALLDALAALSSNGPW